MTLTHRVSLYTVSIGALIALSWSAITNAPEGERVTTDDPGWIREDLEEGINQALVSGKPLLVAFR